LEVGCGTGVIAHMLVKKRSFLRKVVGVDQSPAFIKTAIRLAFEESVEEKVDFIVGDAHDLNFEDVSFDVLIVHTLISHVTDPLKVLKEVARLVRKAGRIVLFDGDYASLTYAYPDHEFGLQMDHALATTTFNNPLIMRDIPRVLPKIGLEIKETLTNVVSEIGTASYFDSFAETYAPLVAKSGLVEKNNVNDWLAKQKIAMNDGTFFASCNYYTHIAQRILK
jgi:ubiquinone/menaquinone biosynthesis C-methylase UbiE